MYVKLISFTQKFKKRTKKGIVDLIFKKKMGKKVN